ncbi:MAG: septum formation initiator family protein [Gammaproteobacteria bacterium]|nr:septum formation initiator family protein [Gammaproteobacteria bacterium]
MTVRRVVLGVLAMAILALQVRLWIGEGSFAHVDALADRSDRLEVENRTKIQRNKILRAEIRDLKNGFASIEEQARTEFGLIKEGETFFLLVDEAEAAERHPSDKR